MTEGRRGPSNPDEEGTGLQTGSAKLSGAEVAEDRRVNELAAILDDSLNEMYIFGFKGLKFLRVNRGARENLGYSMRELRRLTPLDLKPEMTLERFEDLVRPLRTGEQERIVFETRHQRKDGSLYPVEVFLQTSQFDGERAFAAMIMDKTEAIRGAEQREQLVAELELRNAEMERFTYTVSHDLKSPLITICGFVDLLEEDLEAGYQTRVIEDLNEIRQAASKMEQLLKDLLALSRIGRVINPPVEVSLDEIMREALALLAGPIGERGVEVVVAHDLDVVMGDRQRLCEVAQNLLENAIKFMGGQERPRIEVISRTTEEETVLEVRDNGIGVSPEHHERIFKLFERLDSEEDGTGVGLPLVERIIEAHGGRVWLESEGGGLGSRFCVSLPRVVADP